VLSAVPARGVTRILTETLSLPLRAIALRAAALRRTANETRPAATELRTSRPTRTLPARRDRLTLARRASACTSSREPARATTTEPRTVDPRCVAASLIDEPAAPSAAAGGGGGGGGGAVAGGGGGGGGGVAPPGPGTVTDPVMVGCASQ
jgi:hypothetical protein